MNITFEDPEVILSNKNQTPLSTDHMIYGDESQYYI